VTPVTSLASWSAPPFEMNPSRDSRLPGSGPCRNRTYNLEMTRRVAAIYGWSQIALYQAD